MNNLRFSQAFDKFRSVSWIAARKLLNRYNFKETFKKQVYGVDPVLTQAHPPLLADSKIAL
jgi:hypothetical protein